MIKYPQNIVVVCHDAGGANLIIALLQAEGIIARPVVKGPAKVLWESAFPDIRVIDQLGLALNGADLVITGTGWASNLELNAIIQAKNKNIKTVSFLDHWVNYKDRFNRGDGEVLPDEIWVSDKYAFEIAKKTFPRVMVQLIQNNYLNREVEKIGTTVGTNVLYISEPVRNRWRSRQLAEYDVLDYIKENLSEYFIEGDIIIRLHPSEASDKYNKYLDTNSGFRLSNNEELSEDLREAFVVLGMESMAMVVAVSAGRKVISCLPPWAPACRLPHTRILHLQDIVKC